MNIYISTRTSKSTRFKFPNFQSELFENKIPIPMALYCNLFIYKKNELKI